MVTKRIGCPMSYDAESGDWKTTQPIGSVVMANCPCGSTLALSTEGMPLPMRLELLNWIQVETRTRGVNPSELLGYLRDEVRRQALGDPILKDS
jgi:hypothetical protein